MRKTSEETLNNIYEHAKALERLELKICRI